MLGLAFGAGIILIGAYYAIQQFKPKPKRLDIPMSPQWRTSMMREAHRQKLRDGRSL